MRMRCLLLAGYVSKVSKSEIRLPNFRAFMLFMRIVSYHGWLHEIMRCVLAAEGLSCVSQRRRHKHRRRLARIHRLYRKKFDPKLDEAELSLRAAAVKVRWGITHRWTHCANTGPIAFTCDLRQQSLNKHANGQTQWKTSQTNG